MELKFENAADFVKKMLKAHSDLAQIEKIMKNGLEKALGETEFSLFRRKRLETEQVADYFLLKEICQDNSKYTHKGESGDTELYVVSLNGKEFDIKLDGRNYKIAPVLNFISTAYTIMGDDKTAWLIGECRDDLAINTKKIIQNALRCNEFQEMPNKDGPRRAWDPRGYQTFKSIDGIASVRDFCKTHPRQFHAAIIKDLLSEISVETYRNEPNKLFYRIQGNFMSSEDKLAELGKTIDSCL